MNILQETTQSNLIAIQNIELDMVFIDVERAISLKTVQSCPKVFEVIMKHGREQALKLVIVAIVQFQNCLNIQNGMRMVSIISAAEMWLDKYTHESVQDLILALKFAKEDGKVFYNKFSITDLFEITKKYLDEKWEILDFEQQAKKAQENNLPNNYELLSDEKIRESYQHMMLVAHGRACDLGTHQAKVNSTREKASQQLEKLKLDKENGQESLSQAEFEALAYEYSTFYLQNDDQI